MNKAVAYKQKLHYTDKTLKISTNFNISGLIK
jgi:hypothetical protein